MNAFTHTLPFLAVLVGPLAWGDTGDVEPLRTRERDFNVFYEVNDDALPLGQVEVFYTLDQGETWRGYGVDEDRQPPVHFHAPDEGLFGFVIVASNASGASGAAPSKGTQGQAWVFVNSTPPVVQLHELRRVTTLGHAVLQIRWTAIDTHLLPRPVEITYRVEGDTEWHAATPEPLANTGRYDWRLPGGLAGLLSVRLSVTDEGGHRVNTPPQQVEIPRADSQDKPPAAGARTPERDPGRSGNGTSESPVPKAKQRAEQLYVEGLALRDAGLPREALTRLRETVKLDPQRFDALAEMGQLLYGLGDMDRALGAFDTALKLQPNLRPALRGAALVYEKRKDYQAAADRLRVILKYNPADAEVWMQLGDLAVYQGDELLARDCYGRASQSDPKATRVIADARKRLSLMAEDGGSTKR